MKDAILQDVLRALNDANALAMKNVVTSRIPECGDFGAIAQDLAWVINVLAAQQPAAAPSNPLGMASCGKPLCSEGDHPPLCRAAPVKQGERDGSLDIPAGTVVPDCVEHGKVAAPVSVDVVLTDYPALPWREEDGSYDFEAWLECRSDMDVARAFLNYACTYGQQCSDAALERAARCIEDFQADKGTVTFTELSAAIRALKGGAA